MAGSTLSVLVLPPFNERQRTRLETSAPHARFTYVTPKPGTILGNPTSDQVAEADVIVGNLSPKRLSEATSLKLLQLNSAGYDNYLAVGTLPADLALCCAVGAYGQAVSEHLFAMTLALMKRLPGYHDLQHAHNWGDLGPVTTLAGARVLVLGTGDIGSHFAQLCQAMGARVTGANRHGGEAPAGFETVHPIDELPQILGEADVVASFLPSSPATQGLADAAFFSAMRPGAFFANGGRGDLVVADDLVATLSSGHLAGAALDVTSPEPLPEDSPLWDAPNLLITPHVSGGFHLFTVLDNIAGIAAENIAHLEAGEPLRNLVRH